MEEIIRVKDQFYVLATSPMIDGRTRALKQGETFAVFDRCGDIQSVPRTEQGLYDEGTRFPSHLGLSLWNNRPGLLSSTLRADNAVFAVDLTNPDASRYMDPHRLSELFCGFVRHPGGSPTLYPVACSPQAWSSASVFLLLQACLGLTIQARDSVIECSTPLLPDFLQEITIINLKTGEASVDLSIQRYAHGVGVDLVQRRGAIDILVRK